MIFEQIFWRDLGCASYLVGCQGAGEAIVVDPPLDVREVLATCRRHDAKLIGVIETHTHADHVSGHGILASAHGCWIAIHEVANVAYELARAYARTRHQFGRAIARFQAVQFKLADMATEIAAGRALTYHAAWLKDRGRPFAHEASMAKLYTAELACRVADEAVQIHGGYGYMDEYAISRFYRDAKILEIGEGTNEIQRLVIARGLGLE